MVGMVEKEVRTMLIQPYRDKVVRLEREMDDWPCGERTVGEFSNLEKQLRKAKAALANAEKVELEKARATAQQPE